MRSTILFLASLSGAAVALLIGPVPAGPRATPRAPPVRLCDPGGEGVDESFSKEMYDSLSKRIYADESVVSPNDDEDADAAPPTDEELQGFTDDLYAHLNNRPEYATTEFYKGIRQRTDVEDPLMDELGKRRELLDNTMQPSPTQGPNEVIELVLRALQDVNYPYEGHGIGVLMNYTGQGSSITGQAVTPEMLYKYFETSKYRILLEWRDIQYLRKLDVSLDNKRAFQPVKLKSLDGSWVPVSFQLSKYATADGDVWKIDQFLVKTAERRGEMGSPLFDD